MNPPCSTCDLRTVCRPEERAIAQEAGKDGGQCIGYEVDE